MIKEKQSLDIYEMDLMPVEMKAYLRNYGFSFSKKACDFAVSMMKKENPNSKQQENIEPWSKEQVENILAKNGVTLENNIGYNHVYVANMLKADMYKSSIPDEQRLALGIKNIIDDVDASPRLVFKKWITSMDDSGEPIEWSELI